jgi:general secretion pathway protein G
MMPLPKLHSHRFAQSSGFTLIELLVTVTLVGILAMGAMPLAEVVSVKLKEVELKQALRTIRAGLDAYKAASDSGQIPKGTGESGYPSTLQMLVTPIETMGKAAPATKKIGQTEDAPPPRIQILRSLPRDPFASVDDNASPADTWATRAYASRPDDPQPGSDVYDVASKSTRIGLNGTAYNTW